MPLLKHKYISFLNFRAYQLERSPLQQPATDALQSCYISACGDFRQLSEKQHSQNFNKHSSLLQFTKRNEKLTSRKINQRQSIG